MHVTEQVKVQTVPGYANGITDGMPKMINEGGIGSLYKGLVPLWARQIPYTMMKFGAQDFRLASLTAVRVYRACPSPTRPCLNSFIQCQGRPGGCC